MSGINKTEAATLRRIVRDRFKLLRQQLPIRERQLKAQIEEEIEGAHNERVSEANEEGRGLLDEMAELKEQQQELEQRARRFCVRCEEDGLANAGNAYRPILDRWRAKAAAREIERRLENLGTERRQAEMDLTERELGLLELLAMPTLQSDEAMDFLARVPSIEKVLTGGEEAPRLSSGGEA